LQLCTPDFPEVPKPRAVSFELKQVILGQGNRVTKNAGTLHNTSRLIFRWFVIVVLGMLGLGIVVAALAYSYQYIAGS
jgi:hypothetical protein